MDYTLGFCCLKDHSPLTVLCRYLQEGNTEQNHLNLNPYSLEVESLWDPGEVDSGEQG